MFSKAFSKRITALDIKHYISKHKFQSRKKKSFVLITRFFVFPFFVGFFLSQFERSNNKFKSNRSQNKHKTVPLPHQQQKESS